MQSVQQANNESKQGEMCCTMSVEILLHDVLQRNPRVQQRLLQALLLLLLGLLPSS